MSKAKKDKIVKQSFKKDLKKQIAFQLTNNLVELKSILGDKKFDTRIRKASKLLSSGIKKYESVAPIKAKKKAAAKPTTEKASSVNETSPN